jgi:L-asparaginase
MDTPPAIHFIMTGGTIDSFYDGPKDTVVPLNVSVIPGYMEGLNLHEKLVFTQVCMKDSRDLTQEDLRRILGAVQESRYREIVITHGTYTMADTARYLQENLQRDDQVIVFVGSLRPLKDQAYSDAAFNLGYAIARVQELDPGIYVCMNGRTFSPAEVMKIIYKGQFVSMKR